MPYRSPNPGSVSAAGVHRPARVPLMGTRIVLIQGHPDCHRPHLCHALAQAYVDGAVAAGHEVEIVEPARLSFPMLTSPSEWEHGSPPPQLAAAQDAILRASHLVLIYPLWMGDMPALLKSFIEQIARPGFALDDPLRTKFRSGLLHGRSMRVVVSMGMPAPVFRWVYGGHSIKVLRRNVFSRAGIRPMRTTLLGRAHQLTPQRAATWCERLRRLGATAG
jgi:putative NADPH-quinone reductase